MKVENWNVSMNSIPHYPYTGFCPEWWSDRLKLTWTNVCRAA